MRTGQPLCFHSCSNSPARYWGAPVRKDDLIISLVGENPITRRKPRGYVGEGIHAKVAESLPWQAGVCAYLSIKLQIIWRSLEIQT